MEQGRASESLRLRLTGPLSPALSLPCPRAAGRRSVCPGASPSRAPHAVAAGLPGHRVLPPGRPRGLAAGRGGGGAGLAAELQRDPAQRRPDLPAAQLPGRGAGRRAQLRLPGAAQQPGGPEPADPLGAQQAPGPWPGRGHHPGGSGRGRGCGRGAVAVQTQGLPGCWSWAVQGLRADPGQAWGPAPLPGHGARGWLGAGSRAEDPCSEGGLCSTEHQGRGHDRGLAAASIALAAGGKWDGRSLISPPTCSVLHLFPAPSAPLPPDSLTLRLLQTVVLHNASSSHVEGVALLADLETHSMNCSTCPIRFLQPWARQGLTPKEWQELEQMIHHYLFNFIRLVNRLAQQLGQSYPIVIQSAFGCELHPNGTSRGFYEAGVSGQDFLGLDMDAGTWVARSEDKAALYTRDRLNQDKGTISTIRTLLGTTCVSEIKSFVSHGNASLQRQERPVAVVFVREPPPAEPPMPWLLVCRVTGFYPRAVRVAWLQDGEEVEPGWRLNSSGILPNADLTYQLRSSLAVGPGDGHSYACRVQHSSLGVRSLLILWEHSRHRGPGLAVGITLGALAVAVAVAVVLWRCRRRGYQDVGARQFRA
ncbi:antigen-presenting glycoprotein CD1d-like isoform X3 [Pelodiscus sinensis]|uniref:antigen-presenting glycoprotein CD1d-like isoform X3 n=1 Tax=Pelodiscus sinensis TaxID=13735 RepID=UPI003F6C809F